MALLFLARRTTLTATKLPPFLRLLSTARSPLPYPGTFSSTTTDLDLPPDEPIATPSDTQLSHLLSLIDRAREDFPSSKGDALASLRASGVGLTRALVLSAMRELREDSESALLALRWGEGCVSDFPDAWHLMVRTSVKEGRFDIAWSVLRRMHRRKIPVRRSLLVVMERPGLF